MSNNSNNSNKNNSHNARIQLHKLQKTEERFNNFVNRLQQDRGGSPALNNRDTRQIVSETFDTMRDDVLQALEDWENNSSGGSDSLNEEDGDNVADAAPQPVESNTPDASLCPDSNDIFAQMVAYSSGRLHNSDGAMDVRRRSVSLNSSRQTVTSGGYDSDVSQGLRRSTASGNRSFDTVILEDSDEDDPDDPAVTEPVAQDGRNAQPDGPEDTPRGAVLAMLRRMGRRLMGFFEWLLTKIKAAARYVRDKVCQAFTWIFRSLSNLWNRLRGRPPPHDQGQGQASSTERDHLLVTEEEEAPQHRQGARMTWRSYVQVSGPVAQYYAA